MSAVPPIPAMDLGLGWSSQSRDAFHRTVRFDRGGGGVLAELSRPACGALRDAYPAGAHDISLHVQEHTGETHALTTAIDALCTATFAADPRCRRVVIAVDTADAAGRAAVLEAGPRYVTDVDVPGMSLSLSVAEPDWVTRGDSGLDRVPGA